MKEKRGPYYKRFVSAVLGGGGEEINGLLKDRGRGHIWAIIFLACVFTAVVLQILSVSPV